jgi:hypothetical protein
MFLGLPLYGLGFRSDQAMIAGDQLPDHCDTLPIK